ELRRPPRGAATILLRPPARAEGGNGESRRGDEDGEGSDGGRLRSLVGARRRRPALHPRDAHDHGVSAPVLLRLGLALRPQCDGGRWPGHFRPTTLGVEACRRLRGEVSVRAMALATGGLARE